MYFSNEIYSFFYKNYLPDVLTFFFLLFQTINILLYLLKFEPRYKIMFLKSPFTTNLNITLKLNILLMTCIRKLNSEKIQKKFIIGVFALIPFIWYLST